MSKNPNTLKGVWLMLLASFSFALMAMATKFVAKTIPTGEIVMVRGVLGSIFIGILLAKSRVSFVGKEPLLLTARGIIGSGALLCYFWAIGQIDLGTAVMLNYTAPLFAVLISFIFIQERPSRTLYISMAIALIGLYFLSKPHFEGQTLGLVAGLLSGLGAGTVHVLIRFNRKGDSPLTIIFYFTVISTICAALVSIKSGLVNPSGIDWWWLMVITISSIVGQICMTYSLHLAPVSVVSPLGYITPVIGHALGWMIWQEPVSGMSIVGSCLIIGAGVILLKETNLKN